MLSLGSAIPKKIIIDILKRKTIKKTIRESGIFRKNMVIRSRTQIEALLFEK